MGYDHSYMGYLSRDSGQATDVAGRFAGRHSDNADIRVHLLLLYDSNSDGVTAAELFQGIEGVELTGIWGE